MKLALAAFLTLAAVTAQANTLNLHVAMPDSVQLLTEGKQPRLRVVLWGYDDSVADGPEASHLRTIYKKMTAHDQTFAIPIEADIMNDIDQGWDPVSEPRYYVTVDIDVNGDGKLCPGDLTQNYSKTDLVSFASFPSPLIDLNMKYETNSKKCESF